MSTSLGARGVTNRSSPQPTGELDLLAAVG